MTEKLVITDHARKRIAQRFDVKRNQADNWAQCKFATAEYVSDIVSAAGNPARLFVNNGALLVVDVNEPKLITVTKPRISAGIRRKVGQLAEAELRRVERKYTADERRALRMQAELELELAERKLELMRARAPYRKLALNARIAALELRIAEMPAEVHEIKRAKTREVEAVAAYV